MGRLPSRLLHTRMTLDGSIELISLTARFAFCPMDQIHLRAHGSGHSGRGIFVCILTAAVFVAPWRALAQCQPISALAKPASVPQNSQAAGILRRATIYRSRITDPPISGYMASIRSCAPRKRWRRTWLPWCQPRRAKESPRNICRGSHQKLTREKAYLLKRFAQYQRAAETDPS